MKRSSFFLIVSFFIIIGHSANADSLGQSQSFFISKEYDAQARTSIMATLKNVSSNAYFYVEDGYWDELSSDKKIQFLQQVSDLANEFDSRIYVTERQFFGSEPNPGVDGDPRLTILLTRLTNNAGGYFDTGNEYLRDQYDNSNEREMIYLNVSAMEGDKKLNAFLAHEFQHLITFNEKDKIRGVKEDIWLNELRSEYAVSLLGYNYDSGSAGTNLENRAASFIQNPSDSLTEWKNQSADYAQVGMFGEYLAEQFSPKVIADTVKNNLVGIHSINASLLQNNFNESFLSIFSNWLAADILNDRTKDPRFGYSVDVLENFRVTSTQNFTSLGDSNFYAISELFKDWQPHWYDFSNFVSGDSEIMRIKFSSASLASFYVPYLIFDSTGAIKMRFFIPTQTADTLYIDLAKEGISRVIVMPVKKDKLSGFISEETSVGLVLAADKIVSIPSSAVGYSNLSMAEITQPMGFVVVDGFNEPTPEIADGALIRAEGDYKVYVVKGGWVRHIQSSKIFGFYSGLGFDKVTVVAPEILAKYKKSNLVRYNLDTKVYSIDELSNRHWLDLSPEQFIAEGYSWDSIFIINLNELTFYKKGFIITL